MRINLSPQRRDESLTVSVAGDVLTVNGVAFDLSPLPDGATLPYGSIDSEWFAGPVHRQGGQLEVTLLFPHRSNPSQNVSFPEPIVTTSDGPVSLPVDLNNQEAPADDN
ncbi:hypothetical protein JNB71_03440 [Rhizobium herbae]|uniref:Uncharacterized protein n=1 Tax=Rhizobium herbae TaxID=508661 RepID=A0ABS7H5H6_9HYPH|nr:hypothetical protein [Rhizobium herbae]MBW9062365.1 hypothetical protein [Rhizobium herbae]